MSTDQLDPIIDMSGRGPDAETTTDEPTEFGGPVDPPDPPPSSTRTTDGDDPSTRPPVLPDWARSRTAFGAMLRWRAGAAGYRLKRHAARSPVYAGRVLAWAPVGLWRLTAAVWRWTFDREQKPLRDDAVQRKDPDAYTRLVHEHEAHVKHRLVLVAVVAAAGVVAVVLFWWLAPTWARIWVAVVALLVLARVGKPADRPIVDRVQVGPRYTRLTAMMVRTALCSLGIAAMKDPASLQFPRDIHTQGPGQLARVNLPPGVDATDVVERKGRLCSALRLPADQVWPAVGPDHPGQLDLWVGYQPASKMGQPRWSLAHPAARTSVFEPVAFAVDERHRPVSATLFENNFLIGGQPGSGKSYGARALVLAAALDPTVELKVAEFKGTADFGDLEPMCSSYVCGVDDFALSEGAKVIAWGLGEAERRGKRIRAARERGEAPLGKVTPELAGRPGSGLHPVVIVVDEAHELLVDKEVADNAERLIKRGRALGIILILATQIPDAKSVPPAITRCVSVRWCMSVADHVPNDQILGTGSYKRGLAATIFRTGQDAGWGILTGVAAPGPARSYFPDSDTLEKMLGRVRQLRGGEVVAGDTPDDAPDRDPVADVHQVMTEQGVNRVHLEPLAATLADRWPDRYAGETKNSVSQLMRAAGVPVQDVKVDGRNLSGVRLEHVTQALAGRTAAGEEVLAA